MKTVVTLEEYTGYYTDSPRELPAPVFVETRHEPHEYGSDFIRAETLPNGDVVEYYYSHIEYQGTTPVGYHRCSCGELVADTPGHAVVVTH